MQTRAGTARHVRGLLRRARGAGRDRGGAALVRRLRQGGLGRARHVVVLRRAAALARAGSTCSTARPSAARCGRRVPFVVTVHDLALVRHPGALPALAPALGPRRDRPASRGRRTGSSPSPSSPSARLSSCSAWPRSASSWSGTRSSRVFTPDGPAAEGDYVLAVGDARAAQEPPPDRRGGARGPASSCASSARAGWGGVETPGWVGEVSDEELAALYRGARCARLPVAVRGLRHPGARGDGVRHAGRDEPRRRDRGGRRRRGGARRPARRRGDRGRDRGGARRAATSCARSASSARGAYTWARGRRRRRARLAGARVTPARRRRRRRPRPRAHRRRDVRRSTCFASWRRSRPRPGFASPPSRGSPSSSPTGSRRSSSGRASPGAADGRDAAAAAPRGSAPRSRTSSTRCRSRCPCPAVVTIHDLSFERDPSLMSRKDRLVFRAVVPRAARKARARAHRLRADAPRPASSSTACRTRRSS